MVKLKAILMSLLIGFVLLSSHCRKNCKPPVIDKILIPREILDYVEVKPGSYWVYRDSVTGKIDSSIVMSSEHTFDGGITTTDDCGNSYNTGRYENYIIKANKFDSLGNFITDWEMYFANGPKMYGNAPLDEYIIENNDDFKIGYPFDRIFNYRDLYTINEYKTDSIRTGGITFYNILNVKRVVKSSGGDIYDIISWAKNIGIVSYIFVNKSSQQVKNNLIRYRIL
jgi:hypothetical protein